MVEDPNANEIARYILYLFIEGHNARAGGVLRQQNFLLAFNRPPWRSSDFHIGADYAMRRGWIDILPQGRYRLTSTGFAEGGEIKMNLLSQCNEKITVVRQDETRHENVPALITKDMVMVPDASIPIVAGDTILRQLPSGVVDKLVITNPGFHARMGNFPDHYQISYRHESQAPAGTPGHVVHLTAGHNARVNINSTDNSSNTVSYTAVEMNGLAEEFCTLRTALLPKAASAEHFAAIGAVASAEIAAKDGKSEAVPAALASIGKGAKWAFDVAKDIGVELAAAALKPYLGLPPG